MSHRSGTALPYHRPSAVVTAPQPKFKTAPRGSSPSGTGSAARASTTTQTTSVGGTWTALGPQPVHNLATFGDSSGRVTGLALTPSSPNTVYAGTAGGGVWKTTDGGSHWIPLTDSQASLSIGAIALDPSNPSVIYAATGEDNDCGDCQYTRGILKSSDAGQTWQLLDAAEFDGSFLQISSIVVDRNDSQHIMLGTNAGLLYSTNAGTSWFLSGDLQALSTSATPNVWTIVQDASNPQIVFAAVGENCTDYGFIARSNDSGYTWPSNYALKMSAFAPVGYPRILRTGLGEGPGGVLYAALAACPTSNPAYGLGQLVGILKSTDAGLHWSKSAPGSVPGLTDFFQGGPGLFQGDYDNVVAVDPTNASNVVFGGVTMLATSNGGGSYTDVEKPYNSGPVHPDVHAVAFTAPSSFYTGNDGGVWKTSDLGGSGLNSDWTNLNATLAVTTFYSGSALDATRMIGGSQDDDVVGLLPGNPAPPPAWRPMLDGDGTWTAMDPTPGSNVIYGELSFGDIRKGDSTNQNAWQPAGPCETNTDPACQDPVGFVAPFVMDPTNAAYLYAATNRVYRSTSGGLPAGSSGSGSWSAVSPTFSAPAPLGAPPDFITAMAMDGHDAIVVGTYFGGIWLTTNASSATPTWTNIIASGIPPFASSNYTGYPWITSLAIRGSTVWATTSASGFPRVYVKRMNFGTAWAPLVGNNPAFTAGVPLSIALDPTDSNVIVVGTDSGAQGTNGGVFICGNCDGTADANSTFWSQIGSGMPNAEVDAVTIAKDGRNIVAWTHGRGAWSIPRSTQVTATPSPLDFGPQTIGDPATELNLTVRETGLRDSTSLSASITGPNAADFTLTQPVASTSPACSTTLAPLAYCSYGVTFNPSVAATETATLTITDAQGASTPITLTGKGGHPAVSFSPGSISFGTVGYEVFSQVFITATNTGTGPLVFKGATETGSTDFAPYFEGCLLGTKIPPGGTCNLYENFTPTSFGVTETATLSVTDNAATSPETIPVSGMGAQSTVTVTPSTLDFGDVLVGQSSSKLVMLQDSPAYPYVEYGPTGVTAPFSANDFCPRPIGAGSNCSISVTFAPTSMTATPIVQTMTITDNSTTSPQKIQITGRGIAPSASYSGSGFSFTNQPIGTTSAAQTITVTNAGTAPLHVTNITIDSGTTSDFSDTTTCFAARPIAPNGTCSISAKFSSPDPGTFHAHLNVFSDSFTGANPHVLLLDGTAVGPKVSMDKTGLQFPQEGPGQASPAQTVTVTNTGNADLVVSSVSSPSDFPQTNTCTTAAVPAGQTCTVTVKFAPTIPGQQNVLLTITGNGLPAQQTVTLSGTGFAPTAFQRIGANMSAAPSVTSSAAGRIDAVARGSDNALYYTYSTDGGKSWIYWTRIGGNLTSAPAVTSSQPGRIDVVVRGTDNALYYTYTIDGGKTWVYWTRIAANANSAPSLASSAAGRLDMVVRGTDNALYYTSSIDGGKTWVYWSRIAANMSSDPTIISWGNGRLDVFARGQDNALYHTWSTDSGKTWNYWTRIAANMATAPGASTWGVNRLDVFALGQDGKTYHTWSTDGGATWQYWQLVAATPQLSFPLTSKPAAVSRATYSIDLFGRGPDNALDYDSLSSF